jgi:hypothetical protein
MQTLFIPAGIQQGQVQLDTNTTWLEVTFPQAEAMPSTDSASA